MGIVLIETRVHMIALDPGTSGLRNQRIIGRYLPELSIKKLKKNICKSLKNCRILENFAEN